MSNVSSIILGSAAVKIMLDDEELSSGLNRAKGKFSAFAAAMNQFSSATTKISLFAVPGMIKAANDFASFDDAMRTVAAVTDETESSMKSLTEQALKLGAETAFSSAQVAEGMVALGRMGFNGNQIRDAIGDVLNLSLATGTDLAEAATIAANNMTVFGMSATDVGQISDVLSITANSSAQTLQDLGEALKMAGPHAKNAGEDLKSTSAALGVLANMGIRGSLAGTALGKSYKRLADPKVQEFLKKFGISTVDAEGNLFSMASTLAKVGKVAASMGSGERINFMEEIFDARGSLGGGMLSINTEKISMMLDRLENSQGYAGRATKKKEGGFGGTIRELESAFEGVRIAFGEIVATTFTPMLKYLNDMSLGFIKVMEANNGFIGSLLATGAAILSVGMAWKSITIGASLGKSMLAPILAMDKIVTSAFKASAAATALKTTSTAMAGLNTAAAATSPALRSVLSGLGLMPAAGLATAASSTAAAGGVGMLGKALTFLAAHPVMLTLIAIGSAMAIMKWRADAASKALQKQYDAAKAASDAATEKRTAGDTERQSVGVKFERIKQLEEMSQTAPLAAAQIEELNSLLADLNKYGSNEWASFDTLTGKLTVAANAQQILNDKMMQAAKLELEAELAAATTEADAAFRQFEQENQSLTGVWESTKGMLKGLPNIFFKGDGPINTVNQEKQAKIEEAQGNWKAAQMRKKALKARLDALAAGKEGALTGETGQTTIAEKVEAYKQQKNEKDATTAKYDNYLKSIDDEAVAKSDRKAFQKTLDAATPESLDAMSLIATDDLQKAREEYISALNAAKAATSEEGVGISSGEAGKLDALQKNIASRQEKVDSITSARDSFVKRQESFDRGNLQGSFITSDIMNLLGNPQGPEEETARNTRATVANLATLIDVIRRNEGLAFS